MEYLDDFGWNKHDYTGRTFDLWAIHPLQRDQMARKFPHLSPYALFLNNPLKYIDSDGKWPQSIHKKILYKAFEKELASGEITQKQLAGILHVKQQTISRYLLGDREPDFATLIKLCDYFNVSADYLLGREN